MTSKQEPLLGPPDEKDPNYTSLPNNLVYKVGKDQLFIPCYPALVVKSLQNLNIPAG